MLQQEILAKSDSIKTFTNLVQYCRTYESAKKVIDKLNPLIDIQNFTEDKIIAAVSNYRLSKKYNENNWNKCRNYDFNNHNQFICPAQGK